MQMQTDLPHKNKHEAGLHGVHSLATYKTYVEGFLTYIVPAN
jgi:hypothetical protein